MPVQEPLLIRALRLIQRLPPGCHPARLPERVAGHLLAEDLQAGTELDLGIWGSAVYGAEARRALRVHSIALRGDEQP
jgi:hypothetical protein